MNARTATMAGGLLRPATGAILWAVLVACAFLGKLDLATIELLFLLAPLVIIPLGLEILQRLDPLSQPAAIERLGRLLQPFAAVLAVLSFWFPPGRIAAMLSGGWLLFCAALGLSGLARVMRGALAQLDTACAAVALLYLPVGGAWLVASRLGLNPMGFQEPIVLLTAVHFHYAGFAAPLLAGATSRALAGRGAVIRVVFRLATWGILAGPGLLATGFVVGPRLKLVAALVLALSQTLLAVCIFAALRAVAHRFARVLLGVSALSVAFAMTLAATWAVGEYPSHPFVNLPQMSRLHGTANALGFVFCGLLGWWSVFPAVGREP